MLLTNHPGAGVQGVPTWGPELGQERLHARLPGMDGTAAAPSLLLSLVQLHSELLPSAQWAPLAFHAMDDPLRVGWPSSSQFPPGPL